MTAPRRSSRTFRSCSPWRSPEWCASQTDETGLPVTLAGRGLRDALRLAGSPYSVWRDIILTNSDNLDRVLDQMIQALEQVRGDLRDARAGRTVCRRRRTVQNSARLAVNCSAMIRDDISRHREPESMDKRVANADVAIEKLFDGAVILVGRIRNLRRSRKPDCRRAPQGHEKSDRASPTTPGTMDSGLGLLLQTHQIKKMIASYVGENKVVRAAGAERRSRSRAESAGHAGRTHARRRRGHSGVLHAHRRGHDDRRRERKSANSTGANT